MQGRLLVVSGPSGVGKGTVLAAVRARRPELVASVSATTRAPRPGERDGVHYRFVDDAAFDALVAADALLEWATYAGARYGTPAAPVRAAVDAGADVLLELELQGARQVRRRVPDALLVLLAPPSLDALRARLAARGTDGPTAVGERLRIAVEELAAAGEFDHVVVNDDVATAAARVLAILDGSRAARW